MIKKAEVERLRAEFRRLDELPGGIEDRDYENLNAQIHELGGHTPKARKVERTERRPTAGQHLVCKFCWNCLSNGVCSLPCLASKRARP